MRKSKKLKRIFVLIMIAFLTIFSIRYISFPQYCKEDVTHDISKIEIHMIDVGQSESILIIQGENTMLIDTGDIWSGKVVSNYIRDMGIDTIDVLVLTHFHQDHVGGAHKVISSFNIGEIICMDNQYCSTQMEQIWSLDIKIAKNVSSIFHCSKISVKSPYTKSGKLRMFMLGEAKVEFLSHENTELVVNNKSIVTKITFGDFSALLMADAELNVERKLLESDIDLSADLLKVGHHGSRTSTGEEFLELVNPEYAIISCGIGNDYLHPHLSVLKKLEKQNIKIYRTDIDGDILIISDGKDDDLEIVTKK